MTIGKFAQDLMVNTDLTNGEILSQIRIKYPSSKTTMKCIYWYRSDLKKDKKPAKSAQNEQDGQWIFVPNQMELNI